MHNGSVTKLQFNLAGIILTIGIRNYEKVKDSEWDSVWCRVDFSLTAEPWLDYHFDNAEIILASEVDSLIHALRELLSGGLECQREIEFIEPDFSFMLYPEKNLMTDPDNKDMCNVLDIGMDWRVSFWNEGAQTANYLSLALGREDIKCLLNYLMLVTGELTTENPFIAQMMQKKLLIHINTG